MKFFGQHILVLACAVLLMGVARADTLDTSFSFLIGTGDFYNGNGPFAQCSGYDSSCTTTDSQSVDGTYNLFNSALGTLTGVTITLTSNFPLGTELINFGNTGTVSASSDYNVGGIFTGTIDAVGYTCSGTCDDYPSPNGTIDNTLDATYTVPVGDLASFLGAGTGDMSIAQSITVNGSSDGSYEVRGRSNELFTQGWNGTVDVTYDYTPNTSSVPEPSSAILLFGGLATLAGFARRKF